MISNLCKNRQFKRELSDYRENLYRIAYSWCHNPALADDLVQETMSKALKNSGQLRDPKTLRAWLYRILSNCWRDHFRRSRDTVDIDDVILIEKDTPELCHDRQMIINSVRRAIEHLPMGQRQVISLVDLEGCTYIEVAGILDVPIGTVMSRLSRARKALKAKLLNDEIRQDPDNVCHIGTVK
ncbi:RNA polymerase sigma-70 factor (ECF subfamily) [Thiogranum longum]|uniref:RNA polymerase sigma-70 factor (ECF subfamily) n=1 Tax=Thiogranum longum TaxID=1537524 RepID=A0A4R1HGA6_9GAMM|nr:RNA polymerase sigma factor [Thiogranum longum]TCK19445.1 RNA polymerase sigma-70 factor (ECF subfamily) [Thiogranum longum]